MTYTDSNDDRIDSLDLEQDILDMREELNDPATGEYRREELTEELERYEAFAEQGRSFDDWKYGLELIHEDFFEEYCEEYVRDSGDIDSVPEFIVNAIDWALVAEDMREDYSEVDFDGSTYLTR